MNFNKLKSRKLWVTILGTALVPLGVQIGLPPETVHSVVAILVSYLLGQGIADAGHRK